MRPGLILTLPRDGLEDAGFDGPIFGGTSETFRVRRFARNIRRAFDGNCVGYGFAINQCGQRARAGGAGLAAEAGT